MAESPEVASRAETVEPEGGERESELVVLFGEEYAATEPLDNPLAVKHQLQNVQNVLLFEDIDEQFDQALFALESEPELVRDARLQIEAVEVLGKMLMKFHEQQLVPFFGAGQEFPDERRKFFFLKLLFFLCRCVGRVERALKGRLKDVCADESSRRPDEELELANAWYMVRPKQRKWLETLREVLRCEPGRPVEGARTVMEAVFSEPPAEHPDDLDGEKTADRRRYEKILDVILAVLIDGLRPLEIVANPAFKTLHKLYFGVLLSLATEHGHATQVASQLLHLAAEQEALIKNKNFVFVDLICQVHKEAAACEPLLAALLKCALKEVQEKASQMLIARLAEKQPDVLYAHLPKLLPALRKKLPALDGLPVIGSLVRNCLFQCDTVEKFNERETLLLIVWDRIHDDTSTVCARALNLWRQFFEKGVVPVHWLLSPLMHDAFECMAESSYKNVRTAAVGLLCQMAATKPFGEHLNADELFKQLVATNEKAEAKIYARSTAQCRELDQEKTTAIWTQLVDRLKAADGMRPPKVPPKKADLPELKTEAERELLLDEITDTFARMETENGATNGDPDWKTPKELLATQLKAVDPQLSAKISEAFEHYEWNGEKNYLANAYSKGFMSLRFPQVALDLIWSDDLELACSKFLDYVLENEFIRIDKDRHRRARAAEEQVMVKSAPRGSQQRHDVEFFYRRLILALHHALDWEQGLPILSHAIPETSADELPRLLELLKLLYGLRVRKTHVYVQKATELGWLLDSTIQKALGDMLKDIFYAPPPPDGDETRAAEETTKNLIRFMKEVSPCYRHSVSQALTVMFKVHPLTRTLFFVLEPHCTTKPDDAEKPYFAAQVLECAVRAMPDHFTGHLERLEGNHARASFKAKAALLRVFVAYNSLELTPFPAADRRVFYPMNSPLIERVLKNLTEELEVSNEREWRRYAAEAVQFAFTCCQNPLNFCTAVMDFIFRRGQVRMRKVHSCRQMKHLCDQLLADSGEDPEAQKQMLDKADALFAEQFGSSAPNEEPAATRTQHRNAYDVEDIDSESEEYARLVPTRVQPEQLEEVGNSRMDALITRRLFVAAICETENRVLESTLRRLFFMGGEILLRLFHFYEEALPAEVTHRLGAANFLKNATLYEIQTLYRHRMIQSGPEFKQAVFDKREKRALTKVEKQSLLRKGLFDRPEQQVEGGTGVTVWEESFQLTFEENFFKPKSLFGRLLPIVFSVLRAEQHYARATVHAARLCLGNMMHANIVVLREWHSAFFTFLKDPSAEYREEYLILAFGFFYRNSNEVEGHTNEVLSMLEDESPKVRLTCFILMSFLIKQRLLLSSERLSWMSLCLLVIDIYNRILPTINFLHKRNTPVHQVEEILTFLLPIVFEKISQASEKTGRYRERFFDILRQLKPEDDLMAAYISIGLRVLYEGQTQTSKDFRFLHHDVVHDSFSRICATFRPSATQKELREREMKEIVEFQRRIARAHPHSRARARHAQKQAVAEDVQKLCQQEFIVTKEERAAELERQQTERLEREAQAREAEEAAGRRGQRQKRKAKTR
ncbi:hypothetical protein M3Y99_01749100 [Aphelenchoides fujianensis]|nr:hypothetical protein M3Y99_01749100 [Aphelenchoides fujianensis]